MDTLMRSLSSLMLCVGLGLACSPLLAPSQAHAQVPEPEPIAIGLCENGQGSGVVTCVTVTNDNVKECSRGTKDEKCAENNKECECNTASSGCKCIAP